MDANKTYYFHNSKKNKCNLLIHKNMKYCLNFKNIPKLCNNNKLYTPNLKILNISSYNQGSEFQSNYFLNNFQSTFTSINSSHQKNVISPTRKKLIKFHKSKKTNFFCFRNFKKTNYSQSQSTNEQEGSLNNTKFILKQKPEISSLNKIMRNKINSMNKLSITTGKILDSKKLFDPLDLKFSTNIKMINSIKPNRFSFMSNNGILEYGDDNSMIFVKSFFT